MPSYKFPGECCPGAICTVLYCVLYVLATVLPVIVIIGTFALFGTYGLLLIGSLAGGYILYDGISLKNKDEEQR